MRRPSSHLTVLMLLLITVQTALAWRAASRRPSLPHQHFTRSTRLLLSDSTDDGVLPAFSFVSDSEPAPLPAPSDVAVVSDEDDVKEVEFSFESEQSGYGELDGFAPRSRPSDVQEGL